MAWSSSCSRNAHGRKVLIRRAQSRINQATLLRNGGEGKDNRGERGQSVGLLCSRNARPQKALARDTGTSRRASGGWAGDNVARNWRPNRPPSGEKEERGRKHGNGREWIAQTLPFARRVRTVKMCSLDARGEGAIQATLAGKGKTSSERWGERAARCPSCSQSPHDETVVARCAQ